MNNNKLGCFGVLDRVFPMTKAGLRRTPENCVACGERFSCLKSALAGESQVMVEEEKLQRAHESGRVSFLERWSKKKLLHNRRAKSLGM